MNNLVEKDLIVFDGAEICDRCIAKATCVTSKDDMVLFFCNHHKNEHTPKLSKTGWSINII